MFCSIFLGTYDFFGLNHYTTQYVADKEDSSYVSYDKDQDIDVTVDPNWARYVTSLTLVTVFLIYFYHA